MRVAALDLGSNTSLLLIADVEDGRVIRVLRDETTVTRLGQGVFESGRLHPDALARVDVALARYAKIMADEGVARVIAVATSAARDVANASDLLAIGHRHRIEIQIIPGEREAALTYRGAAGGLTLDGPPTVIDVGGGSTEVIVPESDGPRGISFNVGSVRAHERFVTTDPISLEQLARMQNFARDAFSTMKTATHSAGPVIAVAGTPTTLAMLAEAKPFAMDWIHGYALSRERIAEWADRLGRLSLAERERLPGMPPARADVMVGGSIILHAVVERLGASGVIVSTRGVRFGVAQSWAEFNSSKYKW